MTFASVELMDSSAVLVNKVRLGLDEATENPKSKKEVCALSKASQGIKYRRPRDAPNPLSDLIIVEYVAHVRLQKLGNEFVYTPIEVADLWQVSRLSSIGG
jgi:hypothetical protein